jgi:magnesium-transporting ATPase (P-type)
MPEMCESMQLKRNTANKLRKDHMNSKNIISRSVIHYGLLISALVMAFSGLLIQVKYHMGNNGNHQGVSYGPGYIELSFVHKIVVLFFSFFTILHIVSHWKWYKTVIKKQLIAKNIQVITLSLLFVITALTGVFPWLFYIFSGDEFIRKAIIEIHDKIALILFIFLILHVTKRYRSFIFKM